jgi:hypothetical protein
VKGKKYTGGTSYGGIIPILKKIQDLGIPRLMRKILGERVAQAKYEFHDGFIAWTLGTLCGCSRLEQITKYRKHLSVIPGLKLPSHDTIGRIMKRMAVETKVNRTITKTAVAFTHHNDNEKLNGMLVKVTKQIGALKEKIVYTMDIDATSINTLNRGAIRSTDDYGEARHTRIGYNPMVCFIQDLPIYLSMRNGNASPNFQIIECLQNCFKHLENSNITVGRVISDAAGFNMECMRFLDKKGIKFNMRFPYRSNYLSFKNNLLSCNTWRKTEIETANYFWNCEIADITYSMFQHYTNTEHAGTYRVVAIRMPTEETLKKLGQYEELERRKIIKERLKKLSKRKVLKEDGKPYEDNKWKEIDGYYYKFYITNDYEKSSEGIVIEYNKRGNAERKFTFMKNDFSWKRLPFNEMGANAVFMIAAAISNNIFKGIVRLFKDKVPGLNLNSRIETFKTIFIVEPCAFINNKFVFFRQDILYDELME